VRTSSAQEADEFETEEEVAESPEDRARREIARLEEKVTETPDNVNLYVQIADAYRRLDEFDKAAETYQRAIDASGGAAPELTISMLDCRIEPLRKNLSIIKSRFDKLDKNAPANAEEAKKLQQQFQKYNVEIVKREIELYQYRVKMKPEDYTAHYELGNRYRMLGQYDEAIRALQKGRNDQRHKADALCWLGFAFWKKKNYALAETNLKAGLEALAPTNEEGKKRIEYFLGRVSEDRGDQSAAVEHYNSIAAIDYDYKDVATRLDRLNAEAQ
jgi:tetratricopeptide (TPR) repeat protein